MPEHRARQSQGHEPPELPLLLYEVSPALDLVLAQEGVSFQRIHKFDPSSLSRGRSILFDSSQTSERSLRKRITNRHRAIDVRTVKYSEKYCSDLFNLLLDTSPCRAAWNVFEADLVERVSRFPKAEIRRLITARLRECILNSGGVWARVAPFPSPYRTAFNLRVDLDEPYPEDYNRFRQARHPIRDYTTHFVSTCAYQHNKAALDDLRQYDTQSHGHYHTIYKDRAANLRNLDLAHNVLQGYVEAPCGFAGPEGRWNRALNDALESKGYLYSSEFQLGYDDLPFYPWLGDRFSKILQIPVHPVCEGLFQDRSPNSRYLTAYYLISILRIKELLGEPAFVYGHPERRLGRYPEILDIFCEEMIQEKHIWKTTLTDFARWWTWRSRLRWTLRVRDGLEFTFARERAERSYPITVDVNHTEGQASLHIQEQSVETGRLSPDRATRFDIHLGLQTRSIADRMSDLKSILRGLVGWETITPIHDMTETDPFSRLRLRMRLLRTHF